jgi:hypothetical protein
LLLVADVVEIGRKCAPSTVAVLMYESFLLSQVSTLPAHLVGEPVSLLTVYLHEVYQAVVIATAGGADADAPDSAKEAAEDTAQAASRGSSALSAGSPLASNSSARSVVLAPLQLTVTPQMSAFVIASDLRVVLDIMDAPADEYVTWKLANLAAAAAEAHTRAAHKQEKVVLQQSVQLCNTSFSKMSSPQGGTAASSPIKEAAQLQPEDTADSIGLSPQQQQQQQLANASMATFSVECSDISAASSVDHSRMQSPSSRSFGDPAAAVGESGQGRSDSPQDRRLNTMPAIIPGSDSTAAAAAAAGFGPKFRNSRRTAGDVEAGSSRMSAAAALVSTSAKSLLSIPGSLAGAPGYAAAAAALDSAAGGRRRHTSRGAIQVNTRQRDFGGVCVHGD